MIPTTCKYCGGPVGFHECSQTPLCTVCKKVPVSDPWPHDPRTGPLTQPTDEQLAEASRRMKANPMPREEMIRRIVKATIEDIDDLHPDMPTVIVEPAREEFSAWLDRDGLREEK